MRAGGEEDGRQATIDMNEDGGREETEVSMKTERDCGKQEDTEEEEEDTEEGASILIRFSQTTMIEEPRT